MKPVREPLLKKWSPDEDEKLRTLIAAGESKLVVAAKLHRSLVSVRNRASQLGLKFTQPRANKPDN